MILDPEAVEALKSQAASTRPNPNAIVFPSAEGCYIDSSNWHERVWKPTREKARLPELHFHDLRSFWVSKARALEGLTSAETMQMIGHADNRTHDGYTYGTPEVEAMIAGRLVGVFTRPTDDQASVT